jgi:molybdenum cofactor cytidylyltransferase
MGSPKALLADSGGRSFVARILETLAGAGLTELVVVTGRDHDAVRKALSAEALPVEPRVVRNADPSRGQLSSLWVGMDAVRTSEAPGLLVTLVDVPLVEASTVRHLLGVWDRTRAPVVRPARGDRHGHPVIFDRALFEELRRAPIDLGAKAVLQAHAARVVDVPVDDEGCLVDIDTPEEYRRLWDS